MWRKKSSSSSSSPSSMTTATTATLESNPRTIHTLSKTGNIGSSHGANGNSRLFAPSSSLSTSGSVFHRQGRPYFHGTRSTMQTRKSAFASSSSSSGVSLLHPQTLRHGHHGRDDRVIGEEEDDDDDFRVSYDLQNTRAMERLGEQLLMQQKDGELHQQLEEKDQQSEREEEEVEEKEVGVRQQQNSVPIEKSHSLDDPSLISTPPLDTLDADTESGNGGGHVDDDGDFEMDHESFSQITSVRRSPRLQAKKTHAQLSPKCTGNRVASQVIDLTMDESSDDIVPADKIKWSTRSDRTKHHRSLVDDFPDDAEHIDEVATEDVNDSIDEKDDDDDDDDDDSDDFEEFFNTYSPLLKNNKRASKPTAGNSRSGYGNRRQNSITRPTSSNIFSSEDSNNDDGSDMIRDDVSIGSFSDDDKDGNDASIGTSRQFMSPLSFAKSQRSTEDGRDTDLDQFFPAEIGMNSSIDTRHHAATTEARNGTPPRSQRLLTFSQTSPARTIMLTPPEARSSHSSNFQRTPGQSRSSGDQNFLTRSTVAKRLFADMDDERDEELEEIEDDESPATLVNAATQITTPQLPEESPQDQQKQQQQRQHNNEISKQSQASPKKNRLSNTTWLDKAMMDNDLSSVMNSPARSVDKYPRLKKDSKWRTGSLADKLWKAYSTMRARDTMFQHRMDHFHIEKRIMQEQQQQHCNQGHEQPQLSIDVPLQPTTSSNTVDHSSLHDNPYTQSLEFKVICCLEEPHAFIATCRIMFCGDEVAAINGSQQCQSNAPRENEYIDVVFSHTVKDMLALSPGQQVRIFSPWQTIPANPPMVPRRIIVGANFFEKKETDAVNSGETDNLLDDRLFDLEMLQGDFSHPMISEMERRSHSTMSTQALATPPRRRRTQVRKALSSHGIMTQFTQTQHNSQIRVSGTNSGTTIRQVENINNNFKDIYKEMPHMFAEMNRKFLSVTVRGVLQRKMVRRIADPVLGNFMIIQECSTLAILLVSVPTDFDQIDFWSNQFAEGYIYEMPHLKLERKSYVRSGTELFGVMKDLFSTPSSTLEIYEARVTMDTVCKCVCDDSTALDERNMPSPQWLVANVSRSPLFVPGRLTTVKELSECMRTSPLFFHHRRITLKNVDIISFKHFERERSSTSALAVLFVQDQAKIISGSGGNGGTGNILPVYVTNPVVIQDIFDIIMHFTEHEQQQQQSQQNNAQENMGAKPLVNIHNLVIQRNDKNCICLDAYSRMEYAGVMVQKMDVEESLANVRRLTVESLTQTTNNLQLCRMKGKFIKMLRDRTPQPLRPVCENCYSDRLAANKKSCLDCGNHGDSVFYQLRLDMMFVEERECQAGSYNEANPVRMLIDHSTVEDMMQCPMVLTGSETFEEAEAHLLQKDVSLLCLVHRPISDSGGSPKVETIGTAHLTIIAWELLYLRLFNRHPTEQLRQKRFAMDEAGESQAIEQTANTD